MEGCDMGGDKGHLAMQVLDEIRNLIQDRIGGGLAPEKGKVEIEVGEAAPDEGAASASPMDDLGLGDEDAAALEGLYASEGLDKEEGPLDGAFDGDEEKKKKLMGV